MGASEACKYITATVRPPIRLALCACAQTVEVKLLEQRVLHLMRGGGSGGAATAASPPGRGRHPAAAREQQQPPLAMGIAAASSPQAQAAQQLADPLGPAAPAPGGAGADRGITAVSEIQAVCSSDGIAAALREANLERLGREQVRACSTESACCSFSLYRPGASAPGGGDP